MAVVCGHIDIPEDTWNKHYLPLLAALPKDTLIYTGGAEGSDYFTQKFCISQLHRFVVCDKGTQNNVINHGNKSLPFRIGHVNGFSSFPERDEYMLQKCNDVITVLYNNTRALGSGSFYNLLFKKLGCDLAKSFQLHARSKEWDDISSCIESFNSPHQDSIKELASKHLIITP